MRLNVQRKLTKRPRKYPSDNFDAIIPVTQGEGMSGFSQRLQELLKLMFEEDRNAITHHYFAHRYSI
eukprot:4603930-Amphidinium_carterae.1